MSLIGGLSFGKDQNWSLSIVVLSIQRSINCYSNLLVEKQNKSDKFFDKKRGQSEAHYVRAVDGGLISHYKLMTLIVFAQP
jgi:hypothetical protein